MAQSSFRDMTVTGSIRTKLSHLVDDTNDLNNYDTAVRRLREFRTRYRAYRGDGGSISRLEKQLNDLERDTYAAEQQKPRFQELTASLAELEQDISEKKRRIGALQESIRQASTAEAYAARRNQLTALQRAAAVEENALRGLKRKYPAGCPTLEEIQAQRKNLILLRNVFVPEAPAAAASASSAMSRLLMKLFGAAGILFLLAAPFCLFGGRLAAGISLAIVGILALLVTLWLHISAMQKQLLNSRGDTAKEKERADAAAARKRKAEDALEQFLEHYRLPGDTAENLLDQAEQDWYSGAEAQKRLITARQELDAFLRENPQLQDEPPEQVTALPGLEKLKEDEKQLYDSISAMEEKRKALQQECEQLRGPVEKLPEWEDETARVQTALHEDRRRCALTDRTLELLQQAKDNLADSYVGRIEGGFRKYAEILLDGQLGDVILDKDLQLHIDEKGASRELGSFSAGTVDGIVLCMRLAMIDALFDREKPFLILDDPFVNLDDARIRRALGMLRQLSTEHQILYLVCNSSRAESSASSKLRSDALLDSHQFG